MKYIKNFGKFNINEDLEIGDLTNVGTINDITDTQYEINGEWYLKKLVTASDSAETNKSIRVDEHGKSIVWEKDNIFIHVDDVENARYIGLWDSNKEDKKRIGSLTLASERFYKGEIYRKLDSVEIDEKYRGSGYGYMLYKIALEYIRKDINGIYSYLPDRANKKQVPAIYNKFNTWVDEDYQYIKK
jgi:GNAT superfamily N-acetyltransferase